ncbi:hypothetical protein ACFFU9_01160 [Mariniflexile ostreae]|uniref:Lipoprotein n=1 Tax=Mariniflexile ostreae TaxID=1520892 RepID=A0ABV5F7C0_9FLAO
MKHILLLIITLSLTALSCGNDKVIQLPEIDHSDIVEINDVSAAYLFYNEAKTDHVELNKNNLIVSTNWLVNVDKRLSLKQVIPHIKSLQEKKSSSSHKNIHAKNYFTCHDTSEKNLGFIEFTHINYSFGETFLETHKTPSKSVFINIMSLDSIQLGSLKKERSLSTFEQFDISNINESLKKMNPESELHVFLQFNSALTFQEYITVKSAFLKLDTKHLNIIKDEFIYN